VRAIRLNNPGRPIPRARVLGFPSAKAANAYELANTQTVAGGLFFSRDPLGNLAFVVQSNSTVRSCLTLCWLLSAHACQLHVFLLTERTCFLKTSARHNGTPADPDPLWDPNAQTKSFHGSYEDPTLHIQVPLQVAAEREIARRYFQQVTHIPQPTVA